MFGNDGDSERGWAAVLGALWGALAGMPREIVGFRAVRAKVRRHEIAGMTACVLAAATAGCESGVRAVTVLNWPTSAAKLAQQPKQIVKNTTTTVITPGGGTPNPGGGLSYCDQNIQVNSVTSCPFAQNVFVAYGAIANQGNATVTAYSPATGNTYEIDCSTDGVTVDCSGGTTNGAFIPFPMAAVLADIAPPGEGYYLGQPMDYAPYAVKGVSKEPLDNVRLTLTTVQVVSDAVNHLGERPGTLAAYRVSLDIVVEQLDRVQVEAVTS